MTAQTTGSKTERNCRSLVILYCTQFVAASRDIFAPPPDLPNQTRKDNKFHVTVRLCSSQAILKGGRFFWQAFPPSGKYVKIFLHYQ
jgi:hypothetical protein